MVRCRGTTRRVDDRIDVTNEAKKRPSRRRGGRRRRSPSAAAAPPPVAPLHDELLDETPAAPLALAEPAEPEPAARSSRPRARHAGGGVRPAGGRPSTRAGAAVARRAPRHLLRRREHQPHAAHRPGDRSPGTRSGRHPHGLHRGRQLARHRPRYGAPARAATGRSWCTARPRSACGTGAISGSRWPRGCGWARPGRVTCSRSCPTTARSTRSATSPRVSASRSAGCRIAASPISRGSPSPCRNPSPPRVKAAPAIGAAVGIVEAAAAAGVTIVPASPPTVHAAPAAAEPPSEPHTAPHDELLGVARDLIYRAPARMVTLDALANALKARGFSRPPGSPRLITRLRRIRELQINRAGHITLLDLGIGCAVDAGRGHNLGAERPIVPTGRPSGPAPAPCARPQPRRTRTYEERRAEVEAALRGEIVPPPDREPAVVSDARRLGPPEDAPSRRGRRQRRGASPPPFAPWRSPSSSPQRSRRRLAHRAAARRLI